jgi:hypothetical protein
MRALKDVIAVGVHIDIDDEIVGARVAVHRLAH